MSYEITNMWSIIQNDMKELIHRSETDPKISKPNLWLPKEICSWDRVSTSSLLGNVIWNKVKALESSHGGRGQVKVRVGSISGGTGVETGSLFEGPGGRMCILN